MCRPLRRALGLQVDVARVRSTQREIDAAFATPSQQRPDALLVVPDAVLQQLGATRSITLAARHAVPTIYASRDFATAGGLMSYGPA